MYKPPLDSGQVLPGIEPVTKGGEMEDLRARAETSVGEQDVKFAVTGIAICVVIALVLMLVG